MSRRYQIAARIAAVALPLFACIGGCDSPPAQTTAVPPSPSSPLIPPPPPGTPAVPPPPPGGAAANGLQAPVGAPTGKLKPVPNVPDASMYTPDGLMGDDEGVAPWFVGMVKRRESQVDNAKHAEALAGRTVGGLTHQIVEARATTIQGVETYEFLLSTTPGPPNENTPLSVYMCILYLAVGQAPACHRFVHRDAVWQQPRRQAGACPTY